MHLYLSLKSQIPYFCKIHSESLQEKKMQMHILPKKTQVYNYEDSKQIQFLCNGTGVFFSGKPYTRKGESDMVLKKSCLHIEKHSVSLSLGSHEMGSILKFSRSKILQKIRKKTGNECKRRTIR